jgi:hypothetical protein
MLCGNNYDSICERRQLCLVSHFLLTPISHLSMWTNNVRDSRESVMGL